MDTKVEILKVTTRRPDGTFALIDLTLDGVNRWRASVGLPPLKELPSQSANN